MLNSNLETTQATHALVITAAKHDRHCSLSQAIQHTHVVGAAPLLNQRPIVLCFCLHCVLLYVNLPSVSRHIIDAARELVWEQPQRALERSIQNAVRFVPSALSHALDRVATAHARRNRIYIHL